MKHATLLMIAASAALAFPLFGQPGAGMGKGQGRGPGGGDPAQHLKKIDTNGDGVISRAEHVAFATQRSLDNFDRLDADGDGLVTPEEIRTFHQERRADRRASMQERRGQGRP